MSKQNIKLNHCLRQKNVNVGQPGNPQLKLLVNIEDKFLLLLKHAKGENPCMERNAFTALVLGNWGLVRNTTQACFTFVVGTGTAARGAPGCYWSGISSNTGRKHWLTGQLQVGWGGVGTVMKHLGGHSKAAEREGEGKSSHASLQADPVISTVGNSAGIAGTEAPEAEHKSNLCSGWALPQFLAWGAKPG